MQRKLIATLLTLGLSATVFAAADDPQNGEQPGNAEPLTVASMPYESVRSISAITRFLLFVIASIKIAAPSGP